MDHLPIPEGTQHVKLAYLGTEEYDGGELSEYPQRKNWTKAELHGENGHSGRSLEEVDAFFQTWLFFGCLITIFRSVGVRVRTRDFIYTADDGRRYLTTAKLPDFIEEWRTGKQKGGTWAKTEHLETATLNSYLSRKIMSPVASALEDHRRFMERYCGANSAVSPDVAITIVTLQWTLSNWQRGIGHSNWKVAHDFNIPEQAATFLRDRLKAGDWCPTEVSWLMREMHLDGQYYIGCMRTPRYEDDHSKCDAQDQKCGYKDKNWEYETRHMTESCECDFIKVPDNTLDIIRSDGIPIMSFVNGQLRATKYDPEKTRYVAISHVWSDGMGNEKANALPKCQLERLQKLTEEVDHCRQNEPPPLPASETCALAYTPSNSSDDEGNDDSWADDPDADTELAGFWVDTLCVPVEPDDLRNNQIGKMRHIYKDASCVLVLDRWVEAVATTADISDKFVRLWLSNWQHRLWTCQEGVFARSLYFQFGDGQKRLFDLTEEAGLRKDGPQKSTIPSLSLNIPAFNEGRLEMFEISMKVIPILDAVRMRSTTNKKDETVCIATLLGLHPDHLLRINKETTRRDVCEKRMEELIGMIETLPQGLIFNKMERLTTPGYRWAPRTILGQRLSDELIVRPSDDDDFLMDDNGMFLPGHGLLVHFPAYLLPISGSQAAVSMAISDGNRRFKVHLRIDEAALRQVVDNHEPVPASRHKIQKHDDYAVRDEKYAIVTNSFGGSEAIFCSMDTIIGRPDFMWPVHKLRHICLATVESTKVKGSKKDSIRFRFQKKWEWIIG